MPIVPAPVPAATTAAVEAFLKPIISDPSSLAPLPRLRQALSATPPPDPSRPRLSMPVYAIGLDDVLARRDLSQIAPVSWTHVVSQRMPKPFSVATVQTNSATATVQSLSERPPAFWDALDLLHAISDADGADHQVGELAIPALHVTALVLRKRTASADVVVPFLSHVDAAKVGQDYLLSDLLTALRPSAQNVLSMSKGADTGG